MEGRKRIERERKGQGKKEGIDIKIKRFSPIRMEAILVGARPSGGRCSSSLAV